MSKTPSEPRWIGALPTVQRQEWYRPVEDRARVPEEWFGVLDDVGDPCRPRGSKRFLTNKYLVLLNDIRVTAEERRAVLDAAGAGRGYVTIPVVEVDCDQSTAQGLTTLPGVRRVIPALENIEELRPIANGLDFLATFAGVQRNGSPSDKQLTGGRLQGEAPGYPRLEITDQGSELLPDPQADWLTEPAIMPVINMSLGTFARDYLFTPSDIVNLATWGAAHEQLVVVSAGNCGRHRGVETMSAWAQAPWVLSVGATSDHEGRTLAEYSSRGSPAEPESGPDVVACGICSVNPSKSGTSFAAPRVTYFAMICAAAILQLRHAFQVAAGGDVEGVRLVGCGWLDSWGPEMFSERMPRIKLPCLPILGTDLENVSAMLQLTSNANLAVDIRGNERILREMLLKAARPMDGYEPHEVGAGFLDEDLVIEYLANLTGSSLLEIFAQGSVPRESAVSRLKVFKRDELAALANVIRFCAPMWKFDWRNERWSDRYFQGEDLTGLSEEDRNWGIRVSWPPWRIER